MKLTKDTVIFITGGASGFGRATAERFFNAGCKVAIADIDVNSMQDIKDQFTKADGGSSDRILTFECDVTEEEEVKVAMEGTAKVFGAIHVAVPSAGIDMPN